MLSPPEERASPLEQQAGHHSCEVEGGGPDQRRQTSQLGTGWMDELVGSHDDVDAAIDDAEAASAVRSAGSPSMEARADGTRDGTAGGAELMSGPVLQPLSAAILAQVRRRRLICHHLARPAIQPCRHGDRNQSADLAIHPL